MGKILGSLLVKVGAEGISKTNAALGTTEKKASMAGKAMGMLKTAIIAIGAYAVINAIRSVITEFTDYTVQIDKFTKQTGIATDTIQKLVYAAEQEHGSLESLNKGLMNLTVRLGYAGDAQAVYIRYFEALGIEYRKADGTLRDTYDVFLDIADVVSKGALSTEELAAVMQMFGARSAKELIPLLKKGKHWFEEMGLEAEELGIVLDEITVKQGKEFSDQMTRLNTALKGLKLAIAKDLIPTLTELANTIDSLAPLYELIKNIYSWYEKLDSLNWLSLRTQFKNLYEGAKKLGIIKEVGKDIGELEPIVIRGKKPFDDYGGSVDKAATALTDLIPVITSYTVILTEQERIQKLIIEGYAEGLELAYGNVKVIKEVTLAEGEAKDGMEGMHDATEATAALFGVLGGSIRALDSKMLNSSTAMHEWAEAVVGAIAAVIIKLLAMLIIIKAIDAVTGGAATKALNFGSMVGLFQTPTGDMFAYREGLDFGRLFFGGIKEQFNAKLGEVSGMQRQQPTNIIVHTGDPSTFVEFVSNMPTPYKSKLHRETTIKAERIENN